MGQDQDIFEDPEEFRPDRWLRDTDNQKRHQQQLATGVFGFGPRNCLGMELGIVGCFVIEYRRNGKVMQLF